MSEIKLSEVLDILDKIEMFQGQRAGRELWMGKPTEVQDKDLENFNRDIGTIRKYIESKNDMVKRIVERLENLYPINPYPNQFSNGRDYANGRAIQIVKEEGGIE